MTQTLWQARNVSYHEVIETLDKIVAHPYFQPCHINEDTKIVCEGLSISSFDRYGVQKDHYRTLGDYVPFLRDFLGRAKLGRHLKLQSMQLVLDAPSTTREHYGLRNVSVDELPLQVTLAAGIFSSDAYWMNINYKGFEPLTYKSNQVNRQLEKCHQDWKRAVKRSNVIKLLGPYKHRR